MKTENLAINTLVTSGALGLALAKNTEDFPNLPGIYFFFPPLPHFVDEDVHKLIERFNRISQENLTCYDAILTGEKSEECHFYRNSEKYNLNDTDDEKIRNLETIAQEEKTPIYEQIFKVLAFSNILHGPLYVGVARSEALGEPSTGIQARIKQHLRDRILAEKVDSQKKLLNSEKNPKFKTFDLDYCLVLYLTFNKLFDDNDPATPTVSKILAELLEPQLILKAQPPLNKKKGR